MERRRAASSDAAVAEIAVGLMGDMGLAYRGNLALAIWRCSVDFRRDRAMTDTIPIYRRNMDDAPRQVAVMARTFGADVLGISLPPEAILARRYAIPFAGLAVVTELAAGVVRIAQKTESTQLPRATGLVALKRLLRAYVKNRL